LYIPYLFKSLSRKLTKATATSRVREAKSMSTSKSCKSKTKEEDKEEFSNASNIRKTG